MADVNKLAPSAEVWADIPEYEGLYQVSSHGRVRSMDKSFIRRNGRRYQRNGCVLSPATNKDGYRQVSLARRGRLSTRKIGQLVLLAFHGRSDGKEVDHINAVRSDDRLENLRYASHKENCNNGHFKRKQRERNQALNSPRMRKTLQLGKNGKVVKEWISLSEACRSLNMDISTVSKVCRGIDKFAYGFNWKYV